MAETAAAVANYFIKKALEENAELTPMQLIKLVYLAHGWHLGLSGKPLISEPIQAWKYGPVIESLYHKFKHYGRQPLDEAALIPNATLLEPLPLEGFLDAVWWRYGRLSALQLSTLTHQTDSPWDKIWNQQGGKKWFAAKIPDDLIRDYYKAKADAIGAKQSV
jgi:uncharacterized phage-associated protein